MQDFMMKHEFSKISQPQRNQTVLPCVGKKIRLMLSTPRALDFTKT